MPLPIPTMFSRFFGGDGAGTSPPINVKAPPRAPTAIAPAHTAAKGGVSSIVGRSGASPNAGTLVESVKFIVSDTLPSLGAVKSYPVKTATAGDAIGFVLNITVTPTGNTSVNTDILSAISLLRVYTPKGIIQFNPAPDLYMISQRFNPLHVRPSQVNSNAANPVSATYVVYGVSLPASDNYTFEFTEASTFGTGTTAMTVGITLSLMLGAAGGLTTQYVATAYPGTIAANGVSDLAPLAPVQDELTELFVSGQTSNTADISFIQIDYLGQRVLGSYLVGAANAEMVSPLSADETFVLFPLKSNLQLKGSSMLFNWGAAPSAALRLGFYRLVK